MRASRIQMTALLVLSAAVVATTVTTSVQGQAEENPILGSYRWRQIGPANMSGRVSDLAVPPGGEASTIYVAGSAGGLWKTINNGTTWEQVFQGGKTAAVGDIAIAPSDPDVIYLGMGEPHSRNSVSWGDGVWRSTDAGGTWEHMGLEETWHIGRIVVDPRDPDVVYVAALGNLWDRNKGDRGLFKSTNGGRRWRKLMGFDDGTGFYDVVLDPTNPDIVWATSWERERKPWVILSGGGPNNGIWKSTDGGAHFTRVEGNGLPPTAQNGKISLELFPDDPRIIFARIENFAPDPNAPQPEQPAGQQAEMMQFRGMREPPNMNGTYRSTDGGRSWERIDRRNGRPFYYCQLRIDPHDANRVYLVDSNLYRVDVNRAREFVGNYESAGRGGFGGGGGGGGEDRGVYNITNGHHVDFHAMWVDPTNPDHLIVGSDGGVSISWDQGENWNFCQNLCLAQFYAVGFDMAEPYNVYGGLQDNGTWGGPHASLSSRGILNKHWRNFNGGDGFHVQVDPVDPDIVIYVESQGGSISRYNVRTDESARIVPQAPRAPRTPRPGQAEQTEQMAQMQRQFAAMGGGGMGASNIVPAPEPGTRFRFNWSTPIVMSPHNPQTIYVGGQFLFKSVNRGDTWSIISPDLTTNDPEKINATNRGDSPTGAENHCTIITIGESPLVPGLIWVGTDDGRVHVTRDGGVNWTEVTGNVRGVPPATWVSRVRPSAFEAGRAYITFDGHRFGDIATYVFRTDDYGQTFTRLSEGLPPDDPAYVITEDTEIANLVYLGTEHGVYASLDAGMSWMPFSNNLPIVPVHDLVVHPRDRDLIIATHGLGMWVMDDVAGLQSLTPEVMEQDFALLEIQPVTAWNIAREQEYPGDQDFQGRNPAGNLKVNYWIGMPVENVQITIESVTGEVMRQIEGPGDRGLNVVEVPARASFGGMGGGGAGVRRADQGAQQRQMPLGPGSYRLTVTCGGTTATAVVVLRADPRIADRN